MRNYKNAVGRVYHSLYFPPFVVLVAMLLVTYWGWHASIQTVHRDESTVITENEARVTATLRQHLTSYEQILTGGAGLFRGSSDVTKREWRNYISTFDIAHKYPG